MTRLEIATLACKLMALWLFAQTAMTVGGVLFLVFGMATLMFTPHGLGVQELSTMLLAAFPGVITFVVGFILWRYAGRWAQRMVSDAPEPVTSPAFTQQQVMAVAFPMIGLFLLITILPAFCRVLGETMSYGHTFSDYWESPRWQADLWSEVLGVALSIWLIFGSRGIARLIMWARTAGHHES